MKEKELLTSRWIAVAHVVVRRELLRSLVASQRLAVFSEQGHCAAALLLVTYFWVVIVIVAIL